MRVAEIITINNIYSICNRKAAMELNNDFCYQEELWIQKQFRKEKISRTIRMIVAHESDVHYIHTGLIPRALEIFKERKIKYIYENELPIIEYDEPNIKGITFRPYQQEAIDAALYYGRGVIWHSTGTGKSIVLAGIMSAFSQEKILFLVHTQDLIVQMKGDLIKYFGKKTIGEYTGKEKNIKRITVATIQSFSKIAEDHKKSFDVVVVDEVHHLHSEKSMYAKTLTILDTPIRIGLTATLPAKEGGKLWLEALIGPVIHKYDINAAGKDNTLAIPKIEFIKSGRIPHELLMDMTELMKYKSNGDPIFPTRYRTVYYNGIVKNVSRNQQILQRAEEEVLQGNSVLITVVNQEHGRELIKVAKDSGFQLEPIFVYGNTPKDERTRIKNQLDKKELLCVVTSVIWQEGLNLPSLNTCILAGAGKSEIAILQKIGRGLRKTKGKTTVKIIDIDDSKLDKYLKNHTESRMKVYREMRWVK